MTRPLDRDERRTLLELARAVIAARLAGVPEPVLDPPPGPLLELRGAFVTLHLEGHLRGCIGHVVGEHPLWRSVRENAVNAAFHDPRFPPLSAGELDDVVIEVSALTPLRRITGPDDLVIGRHGVMVQIGGARGLLLPQVASELGWNAVTLLEQTCRKAGLDRDAWRRPDAVLEAFEADVFGERAVQVT
jgi:AmmeMemoRadiSam system protein A